MTTNPNYQNPLDSSSGKNRRVDMEMSTTWYQHPKFLTVQESHGWEGMGIVQAICAKLYSQEDCRLNFKDLRPIAFGLRIEKEKLQAIIDTAIEAGLFAGDEMGFWCPYILAKAQLYDRRVAALREAGRKGGLSQAQARLKQPTDTAQADKVGRKVDRKEGRKVDQEEGGNGHSKDLEDFETEDFAEFPDLKEYFLPLDAEIITDNRFVTARWRPLMRYKRVWMSVPQLAAAIEQLKGAGIDDAKPIFRAAQAWFEEKKDTIDGRKGGFNAVTGWVLQKHLDGLKKARDAKKSEIWLSEAGAK